MFVGFVFWYRGLCAGGAASVAQLQLVQPLLGLVLAALVVGDEIPCDMPLVCVAVITCVVGAKHFAAPRPAGGDAGSVVAPTP